MELVVSLTSSCVMNEFWREQIFEERAADEELERVQNARMLVDLVKCSGWLVGGWMQDWRFCQGRPRPRFHLFRC